MPKLVHVSPESNGYYRKPRGKGFSYEDHQGKKLTLQEDIDRIKKLRIPPAWKKVWICKNPDGHLQATGLDVKGRKQYIYHEEWTRQSNLNKFDRMIGFAKALTTIRQQVDKDLKKQGWPREKVIALVISILDQTAERIGNKAYEIENGSFGLTTLKVKHLKVSPEGISFQFKAKSGLYRKTQIRGKRLSRLILACSELPGQEVFQYEDENGTPHPVFSQDVNQYLQEVTGGDFTAKDFRTWGGTVGAITLFPTALAEMEDTKKKNFTTHLVRKVSEKLGNTLSVCRAYYIHPTILQLTEQDNVDFEKLTVAASKTYSSQNANLDDDEMVALYLIEGKAA